MDPITSSIVYGALISGGISALSGKRGGDILKDAALGAATGAVLGPGSAGAKEAGQVTATQAAKTAVTDPGTATQTIFPDVAKRTGMEYVGKTQATPGILDRARGGLESFSDVFRYQTGPKAGTIDPLKVGVGAGVLGTGLYAAGVFDPKTPPAPKIPGANLIYYSQPEAFRPFGGEEIDPSKFPDKPYANMQEGGIADIDIQASKESPSGIESLRERVIIDAPFELTPELRDEILRKYLARQDVGEDVLVEEYDTPEQKQMRELTLMKQKLGMLSDAYGKDIVKPSTNQPSSASESTSAFKEGALVDKLPSKTNKDENNKKNYKRTSGKMVVDANNKGSENKDTMLAQLADGEFVTKSAAVRGAGIAMGADPKNKDQQREMGAEFFYKQMAALDKLARSA
jgi:hypothetical protein